MSLPAHLLYFTENSGEQVSLAGGVASGIKLLGCVKSYRFTPATLLIGRCLKQTTQWQICRLLHFLKPMIRTPAVSENALKLINVLKVFSNQTVVIVDLNNKWLVNSAVHYVLRLLLTLDSGCERVQSIMWLVLSNPFSFRFSKQFVFYTSYSHPDTLTQR